MLGRSIVLRKKRSPLENRPSGNTGKYELRSEQLESRSRWYSADSDAKYGTLKRVQKSSKDTQSQINREGRAQDAVYPDSLCLAA